MDSISLGQRIRQLRLKKGYTQSELAKGIATPSMLSQVESDRARPSYKILFAIAERLEVPLEQLLSNVDLQLEYLCSYKMACAMIRAKEYAAAIPLLRELLEAGRGQIAAMDILYELGNCYLNTGLLDEAEHSFQQVYEVTMMQQEGQLVCQVLKNLGVIAFQRKQYQLAIYKFQRAHEEFEKLVLADSILKAAILFHLGESYTKLGQVEDAVAHYKQAANLYEKAENPVELAKTYLGIGQSLIKLAHFEKANEYSDRAIALFDAVEDNYMSLKTLVQCAANDGLSGGGNQAIRKLERLITKFQDLQKTEDVGITYVELANVHLHHGQLEKAEECCQVARSLLPEIHVYQAWISRVHGLIALKRDRKEDATRFFNRAADCFKQHCEVGEWERTMHDLARLYYDAGDSARAFGIMEEIRSYMGHLLRERGIAL